MNAQAPENVLDLELALSRVGGDKQLLREIAVLFMDECPRAFAEIQEQRRTVRPPACFPPDPGEKSQYS